MTRTPSREQEALTVAIRAMGEFVQTLTPDQADEALNRFRSVIERTLAWEIQDQAEWEASRNRVYRTGAYIAAS
jgi:hypothetical protein